ncbi:hypothetical protein NW841_11895 [Synechococcus sp. H60.3]|uniref:hypothetical protein n=1 Tax=Synechococcus sp. H60.3 TaxID=2967124 RepID=UPI0039C3DBE1
MDFPTSQDPSSSLPQWAEYFAYRQVIDRTIAMTGDPQARSLAAHYGLDIVELTWEDTGRHEGSALGPNISAFSSTKTVNGPALLGSASAISKPSKAPTQPPGIPTRRKFRKKP